MHKLEHHLKNLILETVEFKLDGRVIKRGQIKVFNTKQFFIKFKLDIGGDFKDYELPYPFRADRVEDGYIFDYCLSAFIPKTEEMYWKMTCMDKSTASKLHNNYLYITKLSSWLSGIRP